MQWFQLREYSAGKKRLALTWFLYKVFGKKILYIISFIVAFFTFIFAKEIRESSQRYFMIIEKYTGLKPTLLNTFRHIRSYADGLIDKMLAVSGNFDADKLYFENEEDKKQMFKDIPNGIFFLCSHVGMIEILQSLFLNAPNENNFRTNIFLSKTQSQIFNKFLDDIKTDLPLNIFPVEEIGLETGIQLKENLQNGQIAFMAGDRVSENNASKTIEAEMFSHKILLPKGAFKLAELMETNVYYICAIKKDGRYKIKLKKQTEQNELVSGYVKFLEQTILESPFEFYNFFDFFKI